MSYKIIGAILIITSCGGIGIGLVKAYYYEEKTLRQLIACLDYMACDLQYRLTPLPQLCRMCAAETPGPVGFVFKRLTSELENCISADVSKCVAAALQTVADLPPISRSAFQQLGRSLGRFDCEGQLKGLEITREYCRKELKELTAQRQLRIRNYQTLALCAGAALAILFV